MTYGIKKNLAYIFISRAVYNSSIMLCMQEKILNDNLMEETQGRKK